MREAYAWRDFSRKLENVRNTLKNIRYRGDFDAPDPSDIPDFRDLFTYQSLPKGALAVGQIDTILSVGALSPPHGLGLLQPPTQAALPSLPEIPPKALMKDWEARYIDEHRVLSERLDSLRREFSEIASAERAQGEQLATACRSGDPKAIRLLVGSTLVRHLLPAPLALGVDFALDVASRVALCTIEVPDLSRMPVVKKRGRFMDCKVVAGWRS